MKASRYVLFAISLISAPAANAFSEPAMTMHVMFGSASQAAMAAPSSVISAALSALSACGRLRRMTPTLPLVSTITVLSLMDLSGFLATYRRIRLPAGAQCQGCAPCSCRDRRHALSCGIDREETACVVRSYAD